MNEVWRGRQDIQSCQVFSWGKKGNLSHWPWRELHKGSCQGCGATGPWWLPRSPSHSPEVHVALRSPQRPMDHCWWWRRRVRESFPSSKPPFWGQLIRKSLLHLKSLPYRSSGFSDTEQAIFGPIPHFPSLINVNLVQSDKNKTKLPCK